MRDTSTIGALLRSTPSARLLAAMLLGSLLVACSGSTGPAGPAGPVGPPSGGTPSPPATGSGSATPIATATSIVGTITSVVISSPTVVKFQLADQNGLPLKGLTSSNISFTVAQLDPGLNGMASQWRSYIFSTVSPGSCPAGVTACATASQTQAGTESATNGTLVDNGDGTYQYTFKTDITMVPAVPYNAALTHRVGFEIKGLAQANNGIYTFQPSTGATTGIFSREIVTTATCNNCHTMLKEHGGGRVDTQYCVMCHNPGTADPESGNTLDMTVMIHKIHSGITLPSIQTSGAPNTTPTLGIGYWIAGYKGSLYNFNTVLFPQDTRNCQTCHVQNVPTLPDAANYNTVPTIEACGACHDTVNFATGANHASGIVANDSQCTNCHKATGGLSAASKHVIPEITAAAKFQFVVNSVSFVVNGGATYPVVKFSVLDPTNGNAPYNILTDAPFVGVDPGTGKPVCASGGATKLAFDIAWDSRDYTNWGSGATADDWGQPISLSVALGAAGCTSGVTPSGPDASGVFTLTSTTALPPPPAAHCPPAGAAACPAISNVGVVMEGRTGVVTTGPGAAKIPVTSAVGYGNASGAAPVARRTVVDSGKCNVCHSLLSEHGGSRNGNVQVCTVCHNPASTDVSERGILSATTPGTDGLWEQSIDFKFLIHSIHNASNRPAGSPFVIYGHGGSINDFTSVVFPGQINRCDACHVPASYYPVDTTMVQATTFFTGFSTQMPNPTTPGNPIATSPTMTVCSACHVDAATQSHMVQNGGSTTVSKDAEGRTIPNSNPANNETCSICHGPGGVEDVQVAHNVPAGN
jgi:OmcA/MtrC family decaheme c-type cytochrome